MPNRRNDLKKDKLDLTNNDETNIIKKVLQFCKEFPSLEGVVYFLLTSNTHKIMHSNDNLFNHLLNTYYLLNNWNCQQYVCKAGLVHSIYGTQVFDNKVISLSERNKIRSLVGVSTEQLVYLFSTTSKKSLYNNFNHAEPYVLKDFSNKSNIFITTQNLADLIILDLANSIEQLKRICKSQDEIKEHLKIYEKANNLLSFVSNIRIETLQY